MSTLQVRQTCRFRRAPDVVRCHFLDIQHHVRHDVHKGVHYTILIESRDRLRITSDFTVLGMKKHDEIVLYATKDGRVIQEFIHGDFAGGGIELRFLPDGDGTEVEATLTAPLRGMNKLLKPIVKRTIEKLTRQALEEDRHDLEQGGYEPGTWARSALAAARAA